jgi:hypothetical protein
LSPHSNMLSKLVQPKDVWFFNFWLKFWSNFFYNDALSNDRIINVNVEGRGRNSAQHLSRKKHKSRRPVTTQACRPIFQPETCLSTDYYVESLVCSRHSTHSRVWANTAPVSCTAPPKGLVPERLSWSFHSVPVPSVKFQNCLKLAQVPLLPHPFQFAIH